MNKVRTLKKEDVIEKIIFNITLRSKLYKDIEMNFSEDADWCLTWEDMHNEDNGSWCICEIGNNVLDIQIYGEDDVKGMDAKLRMQGNFMELDTEGTYSHTNDWIYSESFSNVRIVTTDGRVKVVRLGK